MADRKPRRGSQAWCDARTRDPACIKDTIVELARTAGSGSEQALENLFAWLDSHPEMRSAVRQLDDLVTRVEGAWVARLSGNDPLAKRAYEDDVAAMRAELLGPRPSVTDKVLAGTVISAHFGFQRASHAASVKTDKPEVRAAREKLLLMAQRRLHDAVRGWNLYSGTKAAGLRPKGDLKLFESGAAG